MLINIKRAEVFSLLRQNWCLRSAIWPQGSELLKLLEQEYSSLRCACSCWLRSAFFLSWECLCASDISGQSSCRSEGKRFCCSAEWGWNNKRVYVGENEGGCFCIMEFLKLFHREDVIQKPLVPSACFFVYFRFLFFPRFLIISRRAQEASPALSKIVIILMCWTQVVNPR